MRSFLTSLLGRGKSLLKAGSGGVREIEKVAEKSGVLREEGPVANELSSIFEEFDARGAEAQDALSRLNQYAGQRPQAAAPIAEEVAAAEKPLNKKQRRQQARAEKFGKPKEQVASTLEEEEIPIEMADEVTEGTGREEGVLTMDDWGYAEPQNQIDPITSRPQESTASQLDEVEDDAYALYGPKEESSEAYGEHLSQVIGKEEVIEAGGRKESQLAMEDEVDETYAQYGPSKSSESYMDDEVDEAYAQYGPGKRSEAYDEADESFVFNMDDEYDTAQGPEVIKPNRRPRGGSAPQLSNNQQSRKEFLKDQTAGTSWKSHALDYLVAPAVGAGIAGTQKALEYDNERDRELKGLPFTGRANAFIQGAAHGASVGFLGVTGTKAAQSGLARMVGSRSKSLTSSFLLGLDVAPKSGKWSDWAERSAQKTRAVSETVNKQELKKSLDRASDAGASIEQAAKDLEKNPIGMDVDEAKNYFNELNRRVSAAKKSGDPEKMAAVAESLKNATAHESKAASVGNKVYNAEKRINQARSDFQTFGPKNIESADELNTSVRKSISEMPNLASFYMGQLTGGVATSIGMTKKFYSENVAPPPKEGSSSFFKRRNPAYLSSSEAGTGKQVEEYYGEAASGAISTLQGGAAAAIGIGAIGVAAGTGAVSSASGGGFNHPLNAVTGAQDRYISAQAQMQADASERVRMTNPGAIGLNDIEENYFTNPAMSPKRGRHTPGKYNDTGNLTLALSTLRRG